MPSGELAVFDKGDIQGTIEYSSMTKSTKINAANNELKYPFYAESKPIKAYLVLITETKNTSIKWRAWLNNFSLTKEFKPNYSIYYGKNFINLHLFDVAPLVKEGRNEFIINHTSIEGITVHLINSVIMYEASEIKTSYNLKSGILLLQAGEKIDFPCNLHKNYVIVRNPNKSKLKIFNGDGVLTEIGDSGDSDEIETEGDITVIHESEQKNPAYAYLHYLSKTVAPKIEINVESKINNSEVKIYLQNVGEVDLDKLIVNTMLNGITIRFKNFNNVKIGESVEDSFAVPKKGRLQLRIVGIKRGLRKVLDRDINW